MRIAVLSDLHSNAPALSAVLADLKNAAVDRIFILGDLFGYYPWALETHELIRRLPSDTVFLKGNHDCLLLSGAPPEPCPSYWDAAKHNESQLRKHDANALAWLASLPASAHLKLSEFTFEMHHGTPDDTLDGRYYPSDDTAYSWLPALGTILLLGHTHYPLMVRTRSGGVIVNPGSVGQPRDGNPDPSWASITLPGGDVTFHRTPYDWSGAAARLEEMGWDDRATAALRKNYSGPLQDVPR
jgi:predicted phosphodiesterase